MGEIAMSATKTDLLKTIRARCLDCTCDQIKEVQLCPSEDCPLWKYRMGKDPDKRQLSDAQKQARAAALQKAWEKKKEHGHDEITTDDR
jgi:hypothetical protein